MIDLALQQLRYIDSVADGTSFGDAADELRISQSALSQGLARLEEALGASLFEPDGRRRRLTAEGRLVADYARRTLAGTTALTEGLADRQAGRAGTLTVAMIDAALSLFPDAIQRFRTEHPQVRLRLNVDDSARCLELLDGFEADLAVVVGPAIKFRSRSISSEALFLYGPDRQPHPDDPWLLYPTGSQTRTIIDHALAGRHDGAEVAAESANPNVLAEMAALMDGWVVLPDSVGAHAGRTLTKHGRLAFRDIVIARRTGSTSSALAEQFIAGLLDR